ncbi:MAG: DUF2442 domain-containing protein [Bryobacteraceae bacterium]
MEQAAGGGAARARPIAGGGGIHWPDLDEEISVEGESLGRPPVGGPMRDRRSTPRFCAGGSGVAILLVGR